MTRSERDHVLVGLIGEGIGQSLSPAAAPARGRPPGHPADLHDHRLAATCRWTPRTCPTCCAGRRCSATAGSTSPTRSSRTIVKHLDELSDEARAVGAVNTVVFEGGRTRGYNTDWSGFRRGFERELRRRAPRPRGAARRRRSRVGRGPRHAQPRRRPPDAGRPGRGQGRAAGRRRSPASSARTGSPSARRTTCPSCWPARRASSTPRRSGWRTTRARPIADSDLRPRPVGRRHRLPADRHRAAAARPGPSARGRSRRWHERVPGGRGVRVLHRRDRRRRRDAGRLGRAARGSSV